MGTQEIEPFPASRWHGFKLRMTKAVRDFTKRWKEDQSGFRVDGKAICFVRITLCMKGNGELVGYTNPQITGLEPRSHDWLEELKISEDSETITLPPEML